jgi:branched chain amino acid efflux pump
MSLLYAFAATAIMAAVTLFTRAFPFLFFGDRKPPAILLFAEKYIPPMVMVILVLYCLKGVHWTGSAHGLPELLSIAAVATLQLTRRNALLSIFGGTTLYMVLTRTLAAAS